MKIPATILGCCLLVTSCNPDDYFDVNTLVAGTDASCSLAKTQESCEALPSCQPAFEDMEVDVETPIFSACIANPPSDSTTTDDGTGDDTGNGNGNDDGSSDPSTPPTIDDAIASNCSDLDDQYLYIKHVMTTKGKGGGSKKTTTQRQVKVKVCHQTGNLSAHTIIIACPALNAHKTHHDDYIGACKVDDPNAMTAEPEPAPAPVEEPAV